MAERVSAAINFARDCNFADVGEARNVLEDYFWGSDDDTDVDSDDEGEEPEREFQTESDSEESGRDEEDEDHGFLQPEHLDASRFVVCETAEKERVKIEEFKCCTRGKVKVATQGEAGPSQQQTAGCISQFTHDEIYHKRMQMAALDEDEKDLILMGIFSALTIFRGEMTQRPKQKTQTIREKTRIKDFHIDGCIVCKEAFLFVLGISNHKFVAVKKQFIENGREIREKKAGGRRAVKAFTAEDTIKTVTFIKCYATDHGLGLPGRVPGYSRTVVTLLPSSCTKKSVWETYKAAVEKTGCRAMALTTFRQTWRMYVPFIVVAKPMTDLCWTCQKNNILIRRSERKVQALENQKEHLSKVDVGRAHYRDEVRRVKEATAAANITNLGQADNEEFAHYSFDFAQNVQYPSSPMQPGPVYFLSPRKCHVFGVCCEVFPRQVNYLIDEAVVTGKGSNSVISYLDHFFSTHGLGEKSVSLHCDNCSGQNKNRYMLAYLMWRTMTGRHSQVELNFMLAGHTKFSPDLCFGLFKRRYRLCEVHCLNDIKRTVEESSPVNTAVLTGTEDGTVLVPVCDWQTFLCGFVPVPGIKKFHYFKFSSNAPGEVQCKTHINDGEVHTFKMLRGTCPGGYPSALPAPGLSRERKEYLFKNVREFVDEEFQDIVCPKPL